MARILIGWELGANRGHLTRIVRYARALRQAGHRVAIASQRIDGVSAEGGEGAVWQAPLWPRLLAWAATAGGPPVATLGDILARLGLGEEGVLGSLLRGWEAILAAERPDVVVAEYAPALLLATRGRVPAVAIGGGFDLPPAGMERFPSLNGLAPHADEGWLLSVANAELGRCGRPELAALPAMFAAERALPAGLDELDPYWGWRKGGMATPLLDLPLPELAPPEGEELFVYWAERGPAVPGLWQALQRCGLPVRLHIPRLDRAQAEALARIGFAVETRPLPFAEIARRSRLLLSHGGAGFTTSGLLAGRPQVAVHYDLEKGGNGLALDRLNLGAHIPAERIEPEPFARGLRALWGMAELQERTLAKAAEFRARLRTTAEAELLEAVSDLA